MADPAFVIQIDQLRQPWYQQFDFHSQAEPTALPADLLALAQQRQQERRAAVRLLGERLWAPMLEKAMLEATAAP